MKYLKDEDGNKYELVPFNPTGNPHQQGSFLIRPIQPTESYGVRIAKEGEIVAEDILSFAASPLAAEAVIERIKNLLKEYQEEING